MSAFEELKFPAVRKEGTAVSLSDISRLWRYLQEMGWELIQDARSSVPIGVSHRAGNEEDVLTTEISFCKLKISLAYKRTLFDLAKNR